MANHSRQQIRVAFAALLTGLTTTGSNVFRSRVKVLADNELPALIVLTNDETIETITGTVPPIQDRQLEVDVTAYVKKSTSLDDTIDTIINEVEKAVGVSVAANTLNGLVKDIVLQSITVDINNDNEKPVGQAQMKFNANYCTLASAPDVSI